MQIFLYAGGIKDDFTGTLGIELNIQNSIFRGILHISHFTVRHEVLYPRFLLIRLQPGEVGLIIGIYTGHKLDVRPVFIGKVTVPSLSEVAATPCPLFLAGRYVVVGHMQQTALDIFLVPAYKVEA